MPRVALSEMGPRMDLSLRRVRVAPPDVEKEAMAQPKLKKKVKNVSTDVLDGKASHLDHPVVAFMCFNVSWLLLASGSALCM